MSWYERAKTGRPGMPVPIRRVVLALGGMALAVALGLAMTTLQTRPQAVATTAAVDHTRLHTVRSENAPPLAEPTADPGPAVAVDPLQAMRLRKNACARSLIALLLERRQIMERLMAEHPELREIPPLQKWLNEMPVKQCPAGAQQWLALPKNEVMSQRFFELMVLKNAGVWMALLDDPKYGAWYAEMFESEKLSAQAKRDLQVLDAAVKWNDAATAQPTTPAEVRAAYALREPAYEAAAQARAREWSLRISPEMNDYLQASAEQRVMQAFLKQYSMSLLGGEAEAVDARLAAVQGEFLSFPENVKADPELIAAMQQAAAE